MSEKNIEDNPNKTPESMPQVTKPVKASKVFKDKPVPESERVIQSDNELIEKTIPVKKVRAKKADTNPTPAQEVVEPVVEETSESIKPKKVRHGKWVWLGILIMLLITALGAGIGYRQALVLRLSEETNQRIKLATTQFVMAEQDQKNNNLDMARQRLEYVLKVYPDYPGLADKLAEVTMAIALIQPQTPVSNATTEPASTPVPTKDTKNLSILLAQAQAQLAQASNKVDQITCRDITKTDRTLQPWEAVLNTVNQMRNLDPTYEPVKVDGLYYMALRYNGISNINAGNFEVGLYYFALAEQIAPLDENNNSDVTKAKNWAELYQLAGSWYGVDWQKAADAFATIYHNAPSLVDVNCVTAKQRYVNSLEGIGDNLMAAYQYCDASTQYSTAKDIISSDQLLTKIQLAETDCTNPPATPTPTVDPNAPTPTRVPTNYNPTE